MNERERIIDLEEKFDGLLAERDSLRAERDRHERESAYQLERKLAAQQALAVVYEALDRPDVAPDAEPITVAEALVLRLEEVVDQLEDEKSAAELVRGQAVEALRPFAEVWHRMVVGDAMFCPLTEQGKYRAAWHAFNAITDGAASTEKETG